MKLNCILILLFGCFILANSTERFEVRSTFPGNLCILMYVDASFNLTYTDGKQTENAALFNITGAKVDTGSSKCGNVVFGTTSVLSVSLFPSKELLMFTFKRSNNKVTMSTRYTLQPRKHFKHLNQTDQVVLTDERDIDIGSDTPNSYLCNSEEIMDFQDTGYKHFYLQMTLTNLHVQAYRMTKNHFSPKNECSQDFKTSTVNPHNESTTTPGRETTEHSTIVTTEPTPDHTTAPDTNTTTQEPTTHTSPEITTNTSPEMTTNTSQETTTNTSPEVTTEISPTTTMIETTTAGSEGTTTIPGAETTTQIISSTPEPPNPEHKYTVSDGKEVCIVLQGDIKFEIPYLKKDGSSSTRNITVPNYVKVGGTCSYNKTSSAQEVTLSFFNNTWIVDIVIAKEENLHVTTTTGDYSWQALSLTYVIDTNFPDAKKSGERVRAVADGTFGKFKANVDGSYKCDAEQDLVFGKDKLKMDLTKLQYRAFGTTNSSDFAKSGVSECPADSTNTGGGGSSHKTLAIALGCSLAGLVVIIFIAYLLRYRKKKQEEMNYETIQ